MSGAGVRRLAGSRDGERYWGCLVPEPYVCRVGTVWECPDCGLRWTQRRTLSWQAEAEGTRRLRNARERAWVAERLSTGREGRR